MDELLTMSNREITRLEVMQRLREKCLKQKEAAQSSEIMKTLQNRSCLARNTLAMLRRITVKS
jgi:hypothetical protein